MFPQTVAELFDEPACEHNRNKAGRKGGCPKPRPGSAAGGCAFDGAMIALVPVTDAAHLVHGPIACLGNSWESRGSLSSGPGLHRRGFTTDVSERDVIFGGEKRLYRAILEVAERHRPAAVFVYATCVTALIGDDLEAVCRAAREATGLPVIPVPSPGFAGSKNLGTRLAGEVLLEHVIGTGEPPYTTPFDVNLIGEYNVAGELWDVLPLFDRLGIRVLSKITGDARYRELTYAHRARVNMVVCARALVNVARKMEERWGIPWFEGSFYGLRDTSEALRRIAGLLGDPGLAARTESLIAEEEAAAARRLAPYRARLAGKKAVLYTGGVKSWSVVSALQDLGLEVVATGTSKSTEGDVERIKELLGEDARLIEEGNPRELLRIVRESDADILVAGGRNMYTALKGRVPFLDINQERHHRYAGYAGVVELARRIALALSNPVWEAVRRPAPWEGGIPAGSPGAREAPRAARVVESPKAAAVDPLKHSAPLGGALAFLGVDRCLPVLHGSQGCASFAKALLVRHFREAVPLQTTALTEVTAVLGGGENLAAALATIAERQRPDLIGLCTTGLVETQGADVEGDLRAYRAAHPEHGGIPVVRASTPDFRGGLEDGYAAVVGRLLEELAEPGPRVPGQVNVLAGPALSPLDVEAVRETVEAFGLTPIVLPDLSGSLDGHLGEDWSPLTTGGTKVADIRRMGRSEVTLAVGRSLAGAAQRLKDRCGVPCRVYNRLTGLGAVDRFLADLAGFSGRPVPQALRRWRRRLTDGMLDAHFVLGGRRVALALEPDLLYALGRCLGEMGAEIVAAVAPAGSPLLERLPCEEVAVGDFDDLEARARAGGAELLVASSHGRQTAERLGIPLLRAGFPVFDRLGAQHRLTAGYRGTLAFLFEAGNALTRERGDIPC